MSEKSPILIIIYEFLPYSSSFGSVIRIATLAKFLDENGYDVDILTIRKGRNSGFYGFEDNLKNINIHYVDNHLLKLKFDNRGLRSKIVRKFFNIFGSIFIPDIYAIANRGVYKAASELITKKKIENVLISAPSFSSFKQVFLLRKEFTNKLNIVIDYRDSWNNSNIFKKKSFMLKKLAKRKELLAIMNSDKITYSSPLIIEKIQRNFNIDIREKSRLVYNGFIKGIEFSIPNFFDKEKVSIGYFGIANNKKNSYRNIEILVNIIDKDPFLKENIILNLFGRIDVDVNKYRQLHFVNLYGNLSYNKALCEMEKQDCLLVIHTDKETSDEVFTGKLFEYIGMKKPIFCLSPINMAAARMILEKNIGIVADFSNCEDISMKLKNLKQSIEELNFEFYKSSEVNNYRRSNQYREFLALFS